MNRSRIYPALSLLLSASLIACKAKAPPKEAPTSQPAPQKTSAGEKHVKVSVTPIDSDQDGSWELLAVEWSITPGWHIYWTNPGDSGLATEVQFTGASQEAFEPVRLPAPERFESPGGIVGYGYNNHTAFFASRVSPNKAVDKVSAKLSWLVCKDSCLRGKKTLDVALAKKAKPMGPKLQKAFARLPRPAAELPATQQWVTPKGGHATLKVKANSGELQEFFPFETELAPSGIELSKTELSIRYPSIPSGAKHKRTQGVLGVRDQGQTRYYELAAPLPSR